MKNLKIIIVDDHSLFRDGLAFYLEEILNHNLLAQFSNGLEFIQSNSISQADLILMDIAMPKMDGFTAIMEAHKHYSHLKMIAITSDCHNAILNQLIMAGFKGCVLKDQIYSELQMAIKEVVEGKMYFKGIIGLPQKTISKK